MPDGGYRSRGDGPSSGRVERGRDERCRLVGIGPFPREAAYSVFGPQCDKNWTSPEILMDQPSCMCVFRGSQTGISPGLLAKNSSSR